MSNSYFPNFCPYLIRCSDLQQYTFCELDKIHSLSGLAHALSHSLVHVAIFANACLFSNTTMFLALPMQILTGEYCFCWE